jgi:hypothetical protein
VTSVLNVFKDFEFRGKGHEKEDLSRMLNKYEHWIHMLHPKHPFDQSLERVEFLGLKKKPVKNAVKRIRLGLFWPDDPNPNRPADNDLVEDDDDEHLFPPEETIPSEVPPASATGFDDDEFDDIMQEIESSAVAPSDSNPSRVADVPNVDDGIPSFDELLELEAEMNNMDDVDPVARPSVDPDLMIE